MFVNSIPSSCEANCDFQWTNESTPYVTGISPISGKLWDSKQEVVGRYISRSSENAKPQNIFVDLYNFRVTSHCGTESFMACHGFHPTA